VDNEQELVAAASRDEAAFGRLVAPYRGEPHAHRYRMLGSIQGAEDAVQNALLGAWQGLPGFGGRSSLRAWLYRIATNACLRLIERRPKRVSATDFGPARESTQDLGEPITESAFIEPYPDDPESTYERRGKRGASPSSQRSNTCPRPNAQCWPSAKCWRSRQPRSRNSWTRRSHR
jgi:RNA polymerase sigma-70 factor (ECF subfamily)